MVANMHDRGDINRLVRSDVDAREINGLRFILAFAAFLGYYDSISTETNFVLFGYVIVAAVLLIPGLLSSKKAKYRMLWVDIVFYCTLVWVTVPILSVLFLFFVFAIVVGSFSYGLSEGRRVTFATVCIYGMLVILYEWNQEIPWDRLLLRCTFLLGIGLLISYWGGAEKSLKDYLNVLKEVTRLSNPRFGVNLSTITVLRKIKEHFQADICLMVSYQHETLSYQFRQTGTTREQIEPEPLPAGLQPLLLAYQKNEIVLHTYNRLGKVHSIYSVFDDGGWHAGDRKLSQGIADFLEVRSFISVPIPSAKGAGRVFVAAKRKRYKKEDVVLLQQIADQAFTVLQQLELVDRLASDAAREERKRIVGDLHDSTIQPYIGLRMGLDGVCRRATEDNPLYPHLHGLREMTAHVISDLRKYVADLNSGNRGVRESLYGALNRQVEKFAAYYGLHAQIEVDEHLVVADRLTVEILQMIAEGLSNVYKHTNARTATVRVAAHKNALMVEIVNQGEPATDKLFVPGSIARRAESLGGTVLIKAKSNATTVRISIPM